MEYYSKNKSDSSRLEKQLPNILIIFFLLQQFGLSYHISFSSVGLVLIAYLTRRNISVSNFKIPFIFALFLTLSYFFVLVKYGYEQQLLRLLPTLVCESFLFLLLRCKLSIKLPSLGVLVGSTMIICSIVWYQLFFDRSFQVPERFFSLGSNISFTDNMDVYDLYKYSLRSNGIYSEPSYLGMILCCMYVLLFKSIGKYRMPAMALVVVTQIFAGSGLGIFGILALTIILMRESLYRLLPLFVIAIVIIFPLVIFIFSNILNAYEFSFVSRIMDSGIGNDSSFVVRFLNPFYLIYENIMNFDWFGIPSNFYNHYLYTRLYDAQANFPGHNGILGLLIQFGLIGVLMLLILIKRLRSPLEICLLLIIGSQNGGFLTYEKVFSMVFVILALRSAQLGAVNAGRNSAKPNFLALNPRG